MADESSNSELLKYGTVFAGSFVAGGTQLVFPGVGGIFIGSVIATIISDFEQKSLSKKEKDRVAGVIKIATAKIQERLNNGDKTTIYSAKTAEEIIEAVLTAAEREHQTRKIYYYGNLIGNLGFHSEIDSSYANLLIQTASNLTYRQLVMLYVFSEPALRIQVKDNDYRGKKKIPFSLVGALTEAKSLADAGMLTSANSTMLGITDLNPQKSETQGQGTSLVQLMELSKLPQQDVFDLVSLFATELE